MKPVLTIALAAAFALSVASIVHAQGTSATVAPRTDVAPRRAELERQFRQRSAELVRTQLQLNDDQMARLQESNRQFEGQRIALVAQERTARQALRAEMQSGGPPNQERVSGLLDQLIRLQRQRLDLVASEQRELGKFLTPVQRAKYFGLQNQLRKRTLELRDRIGPANSPGVARPRLQGTVRPRLPGVRRKFR